MRGHIFADGLWDMNDKWRSGVKVEYASDDQYLRQYDFSSEDVLENKIYTERFSGRHYSTARLISYQDVRIGDLQNEDQPQILPEIISSWVGEPGSVPLIGGRWEIEGNILGLHREGAEQDMARASLEGAWKRRLVSDLGFLTTVDASVRGDFYEVRDRDIAQGGNPNDESLSEARFYPLLHAETSYPLSRDFENFQMRIEPIGSISAAPHLDGNDNIPNEDSQDIQLDTANIFNANRFPGLDRVEDETHLTYGLRTGIYGHDGSTLNVFAGQSYRLDDKNNPFPAGSGLNSQSSDYVGEVYGNYKDRYYFDYRVQLDNDGLSSQRHEFDGSADFGKLSVSGTYLYANSLAGTAITDSREQIGGDVAYRWNSEWTTRAGAVQDLGAQSGLRTAYLGIDHFGQCLNWSLSAVRNLTDDASGDSSTELLLRIGLKNLGEFQTSGIDLASTSSSNETDRQNTLNGN
jgi:LPS-assembly protein